MKVYLVRPGCCSSIDFNQLWLYVVLHVSARAHNTYYLGHERCVQWYCWFLHFQYNHLQLQLLFCRMLKQKYAVAIPAIPLSTTMTSIISDSGEEKFYRLYETLLLHAFHSLEMSSSPSTSRYISEDRDNTGIPVACSKCNETFDTDSDYVLHFNEWHAETEPK
jgi:hypothetical protein